VKRRKEGVINTFRLRETGLSGNCGKRGLWRYCVGLYRPVDSIARTRTNPHAPHCSMRILAYAQRKSVRSWTDYEGGWYCTMCDPPNGRARAKMIEVRT
jgi:hypothetical protein